MRQFNSYSALTHRWKFTYLDADNADSLLAWSCRVIGQSSHVGGVTGQYDDSSWLRERDGRDERIQGTAMSIQTCSAQQRTRSPSPVRVNWNHGDMRQYAVDGSVFRATAHDLGESCGRCDDMAF
jgi:hypothetical protein